MLPSARKQMVLFNLAGQPKDNYSTSIHCFQGADFKTLVSPWVQAAAFSAMGAVSMLL